METVKHDYKYVEEHLGEYAEEYSAVKDAFRNYEKQYPDCASKYTERDKLAIILMTLHKTLMEKDKELVPESCYECPFFIPTINPIGQIVYECRENVGVFSASFYYGRDLKNRPDWCPLNSIHKESGND